MVELNGLIYASGMRFYSLKLWCYDPEEDKWTEQEGIGNQSQEEPEDGDVYYDDDERDDVNLFKMAGHLRACNQTIGFQTYDTELDDWTEVILSRNVLLLPGPEIL